MFVVHSTILCRLIKLAYILYFSPSLYSFKSKEWWGWGRPELNKSPNFSRGELNKTTPYMQKCLSSNPSVDPDPSVVDELPEPPSKTTNTPIVKSPTGMTISLFSQVVRLIPANSRSENFTHPWCPFYFSTAGEEFVLGVRIEQGLLQLLIAANWHSPS